MTDGFHVRIGAAPISWGISEFPDWGPQMTYGQVFDEMAAAGYEGTELGPPGYLPWDAELLRDELERRRLAMIAAFVPVNMRQRSRVDGAVADVVRTAELLARLGAERVIAADEGDRRRQSLAGQADKTVTAGMSDEEWRCFADGLHEAAVRCAEVGVTLCVHPHGGSYVEHPSEIERLLEMTDPDLVQICFDTGHVAFGGGDPVAVLRRCAGRIGLVHLKDIDGIRLRKGIDAGKNYVQLAQEDCFVPLGQGSLDLRPVMDELRAGGYEGWIVVEQDRVAHAGVDTLADAVRNRDYLRDVFGL